ncbi:MAG: HPr family phosphocarrier protein [Chitinivibrionales bacterium]|nr:HPr family phosphocarrier protein [Chitinivibrionales bacterium]
MVEKDVTILNELGLHARPAGMIVQRAKTFDSSIKLVKDDMQADAKSIMSIMIMAAGKGAVIKIQAEGSDEAEAATALAQLFEDKFNEN